MSGLICDAENSLCNLLRKFVKFGDFELVSGDRTKVYVDIKEAATNPNILKIIHSSIIKRMIVDQIAPDYFAGMELGGALIGLSLSIETGLPLIIVRKEEKEYGLKKRIIGKFKKGEKALFIEDVTTKGGSAIDAISVLRAEGLKIEKIITVVDRDEGAKSNFLKEGIELISLVKLKDLIKE